MKQILLAICFISSSALSFGQCTPVGDFTGVEFGAIPDTIQIFLPGTVNTLYIQQIDVKIPENGNFLELPFITVDSAQLVQISNLPEGLSLACTTPLTTPCAFLGGTIGCGVISGIPTTGGLYELEVLLAVYTNLGTFPFSFTGYEIEVNWPLSVNDRAKKDFSFINLKPNPANNRVTLSTTVANQGSGTVRLFDLVGKQIFQRNVNFVPGQNSMDFSTSNLPEGVYLCVIEALGQKHTRRLMVVH